MKISSYLTAIFSAILITSCSSSSSIVADDSGLYEHDIATADNTVNNTDYSKIVKKAEIQDENSLTREKLTGLLSRNPNKFSDNILEKFDKQREYSADKKKSLTPEQLESIRQQKYLLYEYCSIDIDGIIKIAINKEDAEKIGISNDAYDTIIKSITAYSGDSHHPINQGDTRVYGKKFDDGDTVILTTEWKF